VPSISRERTRNAGSVVRAASGSPLLLNPGSEISLGITNRFVSRSARGIDDLRQVKLHLPFFARMNGPGNPRCWFLHTLVSPKLTTTPPSSATVPFSRSLCGERIAARGQFPTSPERKRCLGSVSPVDSPGLWFAASVDQTNGTYVFASRFLKVR
jgi:hypothetical protein